MLEDKIDQFSFNKLYPTQGTNTVKRKPLRIQAEIFKDGIIKSEERLLLIFELNS